MTILPARMTQAQPLSTGALLSSFTISSSISRGFSLSLSLRNILVSSSTKYCSRFLNNVFDYLNFYLIFISLSIICFLVHIYIGCIHLLLLQLARYINILHIQYHCTDVHCITLFCFVFTVFYYWEYKTAFYLTFSHLAQCFFIFQSCIEKKHSFL